MARIADEELERIKREISIERLVESSGIELRRRGADLIGLCPFHDDGEPSLVVSPQKNLWHCLGACRTGGSVIDWVMKAQGVSFRHAVELLRNGHSPLAAVPARPVKQSTVTKLPCPFEREAEDEELACRVIDFYHQTLKASPEALEYLAKRGVESPEMIERFRLGYSNRTLGYRLPAKNRQAGEEIRGRLEKLGFLRPSGHEHFAGSLTIPIFDEQGRVVEVYGRKIHENLRAGTPKHLYLPGPHRGVWNREALVASDEVILCEALIDALTFWAAGFRNVTTSYGVEGFTEEHLEAFRKHGTKRVLIAYDRDPAGDSAAGSLAKKLLAEGLDCFRIQFPHGLDANTYALQVKPAAKSLEVAIRGSVWMGNGRPSALPLAIVATPSENATKGKNEVEERGLDFAPAAEGLPSDFGSSPEETDPVASPLGPAGALSPLAASAEPAATPLPPGPAADVPCWIEGENVFIVVGDRRYRVRGLVKNLGYGQLKVNLMASRRDDFHLDSLDLCLATQRAAFAKAAAGELGLEEETIRRDLKKVLGKLEELQDEQIRQTLEPKATPVVKLTDQETEEALAFLKDPRLVERVLEDFERCGVVGEETNKIVGYLAAVSRKLDRPLAVMIQSPSAAGKSWLMDSVLEFVPEEERVKYTALTGQSLFYMSETNLQHKVLAIAEEEGAKRASYALKTLQSDGRVSIASVGKDPATGKLVTQEYQLEGPVMIFSTTTAIDVDEEFLNRCLVLTVDEGREQTRAIHRLQRQMHTEAGIWLRKDRKRIRRLHQNAQRLLRPMEVVNPYAERLTFVDDKTRTRRDHEKYLALIDAIAFLRQHQRLTRMSVRGGESEPALTATLEDVELANRLANEVLGRSLDELPPQTRRLLELIHQMVTEASARLQMKPA
ncbi:MAG: toprim domain-containing protein [Acidobacteria bacterium]|nr:MAG: toprim domain-containing protein [Acidobacteriota bacterium]